MSDINSISSENMLEEITEYAKLLRETADDWSNVDAPGLRSLAEFIERFPARIQSARLAGIEEAAKIAEGYRYGMFTGWTKEGRERFSVDEAGWIDMDQADAVQLIVDAIREAALEPPTPQSPVQTAQANPEPENRAGGPQERRE